VASTDEPDLRLTRQRLWALLTPDGAYLRVFMVYGVAISLLGLGLPIAVQTLINTTANIGSTRAIVILALALLLLLGLAAMLSAMRMWATELYARRVYARISAAISLRVVLAPHSFFEGRRNAGLTHRYFDIMTLQKNIPHLIGDGFTVLLQTFVGMTLVSFYHLWFWLFNLLVLAILLLGWWFWDRDARVAAIKLSKKKYNSARWLGNLEAAHEFFKTSAHLDFAGRKTEEHISQFIEMHRQFFHSTFMQALVFLGVYALGSAALLGLGGWLVVLGELSIGQLVAAELIMSSVFFSLPRFVSFLRSYYELYGVADKIGEILSIPQEDTEPGIASGESIRNGISCKNVVLERDGQRCTVSFDLEPGEDLVIHASADWMQRQLTSVLRCYSKPSQGWIKLGGYALEDYHSYELRHRVTTIDRSLIDECTIEEFMLLAAPDASLAQVIEALQRVQLYDRIQSLPDGLDTQLSQLGAPLMPLELVRLKVAAVLLAKPPLVIINQNFDGVPDAMRTLLLNLLAEESFNMIYFSQLPMPPQFDVEMTLTVDADSNQQEAAS